MISGIAQDVVPMHGRPHDMASTKAMPNGSNRDGITNAVASR
jgi:hypothetical protein